MSSCWIRFLDYFHHMNTSWSTRIQPFIKVLLSKGKKVCKWHIYHLLHTNNIIRKSFTLSIPYSSFHSTVFTYILWIYVYCTWKNRGKLKNSHLLAPRATVLMQRAFNWLKVFELITVNKLINITPQFPSFFTLTLL